MRACKHMGQHGTFAPGSVPGPACGIHSHFTLLQNRAVCHSFTPSKQQTPAQRSLPDASYSLPGTAVQEVHKRVKRGRRGLPLGELILVRMLSEAFWLLNTPALHSQ